MNLFRLFIFVSICLLSISGTNPDPMIGTVIDYHNGVPVYFNGRNYKRVEGRNMTHDGYNLGLKYQCVEFVKRYFYERFGHKMPNSYGHAKDFFDQSLPDIGYNNHRGMMQYRNVRESAPQVDDLVVYGAHQGNPYGHVAIITEVTDIDVEIIQQNKRLESRQRIPLVKYLTYYTIADYNIVGWLRLQ